MKQHNVAERCSWQNKHHKHNRRCNRKSALYCVWRSKITFFYLLFHAVIIQQAAAADSQCSYTWQLTAAIYSISETTRTPQCTQLDIYIRPFIIIIVSIADSKQAMTGTWSWAISGWNQCCSFGSCTTECVQKPPCWYQAVGTKVKRQLNTISETSSHWRIMDTNWLALCDFLLVFYSKLKKPWWISLHYFVPPLLCVKVKRYTW